MHSRLELELKADPSEAKRLRNELHAWLLDAGINGPTGFDITLAATEAFINTIEHPVQRLSKQVSVQGEISADRTVVLKISDDGRWQQQIDAGRDQYGYSLIRATVTSIEIRDHDHGTTVTLIRHA
jgi:anti-sigma regulatory factor (Ser/Thr protein kinase)